MQMNKADKHEMAAVKERQMIDGRVREQVDTLRVLTENDKRRGPKAHHKESKPQRVKTLSVT